MASKMMKSMVILYIPVRACSDKSAFTGVINQWLAPSLKKGEEPFFRP